jgi:hypothetical protein
MARMEIVAGLAMVAALSVPLELLRHRFAV